ncbi:hypothetical protein CONPUDRAFT_142189 [Coniophora puteana RWD-64-598 SS2]|uniref:F-box domain-containing protein n=1 Tax=Coniophora puteana (strain RWD-64-598) TaxID=741705 RepID=A0A5M3N2Z3_CONPW|nr:uncharacterized protein CONPUDRAFT_142189 [Coniophora puteana RWD-64-598 SS2]EIW85759.1 hypothetical protein CONPUDRAFT_142189 [Coniophora puteana RWD-64-598 SS2]
MSPTHSKIANSTHHPHSILSLAPETMLGIFGFLYHDAKTSACDDPSAGFPFSPAHVCRYWLDILSLKPSYWSTIIVPLHLPLVPSILSIYSDVLGQQSTISECRIYCNSSPCLPSSTENSRINAAMRALAPHLHKCETISICPRYCSSTVLASRYLNGLDTERLVYFSLFCSETDTTEDAHFTSFTCTRLLWLYMDAKTLISFAWSEGSKCGEDFDGRLRVYVKLYCPSNGPSYLAPSALITALVTLTKRSECIDCLNIDGVSFDKESVHPPALQDDINVITVELTDLHGAILREFFLRFEGGDGRIVQATRCTFDSPIIMQDVPILYLEGMDDGAAVLCALRHWDGTSLEIKNCPGFTDAALNMLTSEDLCS